MDCLLDQSAGVRLNAALLVHEVAKKSSFLCEKMLADGGIAVLGKHLLTEVIIMITLARPLTNIATQYATLLLYILTLWLLYFRLSVV